MHEEAMDTNARQDHTHNAYNAITGPDASCHDSNSDAFEECELATNRTNNVEFKDIEASDDRFDTIDGHAKIAGDGTDDEFPLDGNPDSTNNTLEEGAVDGNNNQVQTVSSSHLKHYSSNSQVQTLLTDNGKQKPLQTNSKKLSQHTTDQPIFMFSNNPIATNLISTHNKKCKGYNESLPRSNDVSQTVMSEDLMKDNQVANKTAEVDGTHTNCLQINPEIAKMDKDTQDENHAPNENGIH